MHCCLFQLSACVKNHMWKVWTLLVTRPRTWKRQVVFLGESPEYFLCWNRCIILWDIGRFGFSVSVRQGKGLDFMCVARIIIISAKNSSRLFSRILQTKILLRLWLVFKSSKILATLLSIMNPWLNGLTLWRENFISEIVIIISALWIGIFVNCYVNNLVILRRCFCEFFEWKLHGRKTVSCC